MPLIILRVTSFNCYLCVFLNIESHGWSIVHLCRCSKPISRTVAGLRRADSICWDAPKGLYHPRGTSFVLFRAGLPDGLSAVIDGIVCSPLERHPDPTLLPNVAFSEQSGSGALQADDREECEAG